MRLPSPRILAATITTALLLLVPSATRAQDSPAGAQVDPRVPEALAWYTGTSGRVDDVRARRLLEAAAADGDAVARMWMARALSRGRMGLEEDRDAARALADTLLPRIRRLAEEGAVEAVFLLGTAYDEGLGVAEDPARAARWHRRAAEAGHVLGAHVLGNQYAAGRGVERDASTAVRWWLPAGRAGDAVVQLRLGEAYERGMGVEPDRDEALRWYRAAAARGNVRARDAVARLEGGGAP